MKYTPQSALLALLIVFSGIATAHAQGSSCSGKIIDTNPHHTYIDARDDGRLRGTPLGLDRIIAFFEGSAAAMPDCFSLEKGSPDSDLQIASVNIGGDHAEIVFTRPIAQSDGWVTLIYNGAEERTKIDFAQLWGDVDGSRQVNGSDLIYHIDCMNQARVCAVDRVDLDRSGLVAPADILSRVDSINHNYGASLPPHPNDRSDPKIKLTCRLSRAVIRALREKIKASAKDAGAKSVGVALELSVVGGAASLKKTFLASEVLSPTAVLMEPAGSLNPGIYGDPGGSPLACSVKVNYTATVKGVYGPDDVRTGQSSGTLTVPGVYQ